jgi:hypothetical protein
MVQSFRASGRKHYGPVGLGRLEAVLFDAPWERVVMLRLASGHVGSAETWPRGAEVFVVEGDLVVDGTTHRAGSWIRLPPGSSLALASSDGALLYR